MKNSLNIFCPAKLNLYLSLQKKLTNGYHSINSFIIFINLFDKLNFIESNETVLKVKGSFSKNFYSHCSVNNNSIINVVNYIKKIFKIDKNVTITLEKHIPIGAGLAGGSTDAAATLKALNVLWDLKLDNTKLITIAKNFGADTTLFLYSKSCILEGIGSRVTPVDLPNVKLPILLINNLKYLSTEQVYKNSIIRNTNKKIIIPSSISTNKKIFLDFIKEQNNDLEPAAIKIIPEIKIILEELNKTDPLLSRMTGSGSTCFAIYKSKQDLKIALDKLRAIYPNYLITTVCNI